MNEDIKENEMYCPECGGLIDIDSINCKFCFKNIDDIIKNSQVKYWSESTLTKNLKGTLNDDGGGEEEEAKERDPWINKYFELNSTAEERTKEIEYNKKIDTTLQVTKIVGASILGGILGGIIGFFKA